MQTCDIEKYLQKIYDTTADCNKYVTLANLLLMAAGLQNICRKRMREIAGGSLKLSGTFKEMSFFFTTTVSWFVAQSMYYTLVNTHTN
jgi:hypothetical protein